MALCVTQPNVSVFIQCTHFCGYKTSRFILRGNLGADLLLSSPSVLLFQMSFARLSSPDKMEVTSPVRWLGLCILIGTILQVTLPWPRSTWGGIPDLMMENVTSWADSGPVGEITSWGNRGFFALARSAHWPRPLEMFTMRPHHREVVVMALCVAQSNI
jgi:hypothetical protein